MKHLFIKYFSATTLGIFIVALILLAMSASSCKKQNNCYTCKTEIGIIKSGAIDSVRYTEKCDLSQTELKSYQSANTYLKPYGMTFVSYKTVCTKQ